jgi:hypothetical protein
MTSSIVRHSVLKNIDLDTLEFYPENIVTSLLGETRCDVVVKCKSKSDPDLEYGFLILVEHQTKNEIFMSLRIEKYLINLLDSIGNKIDPIIVNNVEKNRFISYSFSYYNSPRNYLEKLL